MNYLNTTTSFDEIQLAVNVYDLEDQSGLPVFENRPTVHHTAIPSDWNDNEIVQPFLSEILSWLFESAKNNPENTPDEFLDLMNNRFAMAVGYPNESGPRAIIAVENDGEKIMCSMVPAG